MKHLKTQNQLNEATENFNISDVIRSLYQLKQHLENKRAPRLQGEVDGTSTRRETPN